VTSTSLPSSLQPGSGGSISIITTQLPDAVAGRSYSFDLSANVGSGALSSCSLAASSGSLPSGLSWSISATTANICTLSGATAGTAGSYAVVITATDNSSPPKTAQLATTLTIRPEFTISQASLADAVSNRTYGESGSTCAGSTACAQPVTTTLAATTPATVGASTSGNGPIATGGCSPTASPFSVTPSNPALSIAISATAANQCAITSPAVSVVAANTTYSVKISVIDNPITVSTQTRAVVPANTITKTISLTVHPPISLAQTLGAHWPDAVEGRSYGSAANGCTGTTGACAAAIYTASNGLGGYVWPSTIPASLSALAPMACTPAATTYTCNTANAAVTATTGVYAPSVTVSDTANTATPAATVSTDPLSTRTDAVNVDAPITFSVNFDNYPNTPTGAVTQAEVPDAVVGRPYGAGAGNGKNSLVFVATGGLLTTAGLGFSQGTTYNLPAGVACAPFLPAVPVASSYLVATANLSCSSSGANVTGATGPYPFAIAVSDPGNASTPSSAASSTTATSDILGHASHTLTVDPVLSVTLAQPGNAASPNPANLLDGVAGRTYGAIGGTPVYTPAGGLGQSTTVGVLGNSYYQWCISAGTLPAPFLTSGGTNLNATCPTVVEAPVETVQATSVLPGAGTTAPAVDLSDTGNATTPSATVISTTSLLVHPVLVASLSQNSIPVASGGSLLDGVMNRLYGSGAYAAGAPTYSATGGLMVGTSPTYLWCVNSGAGSLPPNLVGISTNCGAATSTGSNLPVTLTASAASPINGTGTFTFTVEADDGGNAAVPSTFAIPADNSTVTASVKIHPQIAVSLNFAPPPDAVNGRTYGSPNRTDLIYQVAANDGLVPITMNGSGFPAPITCPQTVNSVSTSISQLNCNSGNAVVTGATSTGTVTAVDSANAAVPAATPGAAGTDPQSQRTADTIHVDAPLALAVDASSIDPPQNGVQGRSYGNTGAGFTALIYDASGGLGPSAYPAGTYSFAGVTPIANPGTGVPTGVVCTPGATLITCGSGANTVTAAPGAYILTTTLDDVANSTTQSGSQSSTTFALPNKTITINAPLALASDSTSADFGTTPPNGVQGRTYGNTGAGFQALIYDATGGLGPSASPAGTYSFTPISSIGAVGTGVPAAVACTPTATAMTCTSGASTVTANPGNYTYSTTLSDTANAMTPGAAASGTTFALPNHTITINAPLALASDANSADFGTTPPNGVQGRSYGYVGGGFHALIYDATGGLGPSASPAGTYSLTAISSIAAAGTGVPAAVACTAGATAMTCTSGASTVTAGTGAYTFSTTLSDTANAATPSAAASATTFALPNKTITINAPLALAVDGASIDPPQTGVTGRSYGNAGAGFTPLIYDASGGLGPSAFPVGSYSFSGVTPIATPGTGVPAGVACTPAATSITCTSGASTVTAAAGNYTLTTTLNDVANLATPSGSQSSTTYALPNKTIPIAAALSLSSDANSADFGTAPPNGVQGRTYGNTGAGFKALIYDAAGGLGPSASPAGTYSLTAISSIAAAGTGVPSAVACTAGATAMTCSSGASTVSAGTGAYTFSTTLSDTANAMTPSAAASGTTFALPNHTITINAPLALASDATSADFGTTPPNGVQGRSYGNVGGGFHALIYDASGGLGPSAFPAGTYSFTPISSIAATGTGVPSAVACNAGATAMTCSSGASTVSAGTGPYTFSTTLSDTANAATPSATASGTTFALPNKTITINAPLALAVDGASIDPPQTGVTGRTYGNAGAGFTPLIYDASGGLGPSASPAGSYSFSGVTPIATPGTGVPAGVACTPAATSITCTSGASTVTAAAGNYTLTTTLNDVANLATPSGSQSSTTYALPNKTIPIAAALSLAVDAASVDPPPVSVQGRTYGNAAGTCGASPCKALVYDASGGLGPSASPVGTYNFSAISTIAAAGTGVPTGVTCTSGSTTMTCTSGATTVSGGTGSYTFSTTLGDSANAMTPSAAVSATTFALPNKTLTVNAPLSIQLTQATSATLTNTNPANLLSGVTGRSYGNPTGTPTYTASGGLGATTPADYEWCVNTGSSSLPAGLVGITPSSGTSAPCTTFGITSGNPAIATLSSTNITQVITGTSQVFSPTVELDDTGNASTPTSVASSTSATNSTNLRIHEALAITPNFPSGVGNGFAAPDAVVNRAYGTGSGCYNGTTSVACTPLTFPPSGGIPPYTYTTTGNGNWPTGFSCTTTGCTAATGAITTSGSYNPTVKAVDTGNYATPSGTVTSSGTLTVDPVLSVKLTQATSATLSNTNPATLLPGATGRSYGNPTGTPTYTAAGGLGATTPADYEWCVNTGSSSLPAGLVGITAATAAPCNAFGSTSGTPGVATLSSTNITAIIAGNFQTFSPTVELDDIGNLTTPSSVTVAGAPATSSTSLRIHSALSITPGIASPFPDAVVGRPYGTGTGCSGGACTPLTFPPTGGLPPFTYTTTANSTWPAGFACTTSGCSAAAGAITTAGPYSPQVSVTDTANYAAPSGSTSFTGSLNVDPALTLAVTIGSGGPNVSNVAWPDGVTGRPYGTGNGCNPTSSCAPPIFAASNGLGGYSYSNYPTLTGIGFVCTPSGSPVILTCATGPTGTPPNALGGVGTYSPSVTATDTANSTTPAATITSDPNSILTNTNDLIVDPEIAIQNSNVNYLPSGEAGQPYSVLFSCQVGTGTCGGTGIPNNAKALYTWSASNLTSSSSGSYAGTSLNFAFPGSPVGQPGAAPFAGTPPIPSPVTTVGNSWSAQVTVTDNGNATTPSCTAAGTCPPLTTFSGYLFPSLAFVGSNSAALDVFDTSGAAPVFLETITDPGVADTPNYPAVSPGGQVLFVADPGNHIVFLGNDENGTFAAATPASVPPLSSLAGDTVAVAVGPASTAFLNNPYDFVYGYVANGGTHDVQVIDGGQRSATYASVKASITFNGTPSFVDIKVAPTFNVGGNRLTHGYVLDGAGNQVCVFDAEPSSASFLTQIGAANSASTPPPCIPLVEAGVTPRFIDVSPDGRYAFVTEGNGTDGYLEVIDINPNDAAFETALAPVNLTPGAPSGYQTIATGDGATMTFSNTFTPNPISPGNLLEVVAGAVTGYSNSSGVISGTGISGTVNYATGAISVTFSSPPTNGTLVQAQTVSAGSTNPAGVRVSPDAQTVWVAGEDTSTLLGFETANVNGTQFSLTSYSFTPDYASGVESPIGIAFRPDGAFGLASLSAAATPAIFSFTLTGAGSEVATTGVATPWGVDHLPNPVLHITTSALPAATNSVAYQASIVAAGPNPYYTFTELTSLETTTLATLGLNLSSNGVVTTTTPASLAAGSYTFYIQVSDQSQPVNNVVVKAITLQVN